MEITAQIFGILAMICYISSYQFKKDLTVILMQLMGSTFYTLQYVFLCIINATLYMGLFMNAIGIFRALVYYKRDFFHAESKLWIYGFFSTYLACYVLLFTIFGTQATPLNLALEFLPIIGMVLTQISYKLKSAKTIRTYALFNSIPWGLYHGTHGSIGGTVGEIINFLSALIGIFRHDIRKKNYDNKKQS